MSAREWNAAIMLAAQLVVSAWLLASAPADMAQTATAAAGALRAIAFAILVTLVANIIAGIAFGIARRGMQEPADERDRLINLRSTRNAYFALSIGVGGCLILWAIGAAPALGVYALFGTLILAEVIHAGSQLIYYRIG